MADLISISTPEPDTKCKVCGKTAQATVKWDDGIWEQMCQEHALDVAKEAGLLTEVPENA